MLPVWEFTNKRKLCASCFSRYFEKKFLNTVRKFKLFSACDKVQVKCESEDKLSEIKRQTLSFVLEKMRAKLNIALVKRNATKKASVDSVDNIASCLLDCFVNKRLRNMKRCGPIRKEKIGKRWITIVKPFYLFLDAEILLYAKIKKIVKPNILQQWPFRPGESFMLSGLREVGESKNKMRKKLLLFLDELEKKHPEVKHAIVQGYLSVYVT